MLNWPEEISLAGIVSSCKEHKLAYEINHAMGLSFRRSQHDIEIYSSEKIPSLSANLFVEESDDKLSTHSVFVYEDTVLYRDYFLISNKGTNGWLLPELKNLDFVLMLKTTYLPEDAWSEIMSVICEIPDVNNMFLLDPEKVPSKFNLLL